jgi:hypothetical protein
MSLWNIPSVHNHRIPGPDRLGYINLLAAAQPDLRLCVDPRPYNAAMELTQSLYMGCTVNLLKGMHYETCHSFRVAWLEAKGRQTIIIS